MSKNPHPFTKQLGQKLAKKHRDKGHVLEEDVAEIRALLDWLEHWRQTEVVLYRHHGSTSSREGSLGLHAKNAVRRGVEEYVETLIERVEANQ